MNGIIAVMLTLMINRLLQVQYVSVHLPAAAQLGAPARRALRPDAGEPGAQSTRKVSHTGALRNTRAFRNVISTGYENLDGTPDLQEPHLAASVHSKAQAALDPRERAPESTDRAVF